MDDGPGPDALASTAPRPLPQHRLSILIPVYNEAATVGATIERILAVNLPIEREIVVVDDGSTDDTWSLLQGLQTPDLRLFRHSANRGKGSALRTALDAATGDICVVQDADLEYDPNDLPSLIAPLLHDEADMVYGSRFTGDPRGMKLVFRLGNWVLAWMATLLYGRRVTDEATCYKAFRTDLLRGMNLQCTGFEFCPEVTAKGLKGHARYAEVPIRYEARGANEGKKITWRHGVQAIWTLLKYRFVG